MASSAVASDGRAVLWDGGGIGGWRRGFPECSVAAVVKEGLGKGLRKQILSCENPPEADEQQDPGVGGLPPPSGPARTSDSFLEVRRGGLDVSNETSDENARVLGLQIAYVLNSPFVRRDVMKERDWWQVPREGCD